MKPFFASPGSPLPLGASISPNGVNFSIFSRHAARIDLLFFRPHADEIFAQISLDPKINRTGDLWHIKIHDLDLSLRYGYRVYGKDDLDQRFHHFNPDTILLDPYVRAVSNGSRWGKRLARGGEPPVSGFVRRGLIVDDAFDWEGDRPLNRPLAETIIYELHVRGFTINDPQVKARGTYAGLIEKIPYLKELGISAVELLPICEFDENDNPNKDPKNGKALKNFWGYSPISFFSPKAAYCVNGREGNQVREFKEMVKAMHRAGIEVILDMVFNHTGEGGTDGPTINFRGLDNTIYYLLEEASGGYLNYSGCGNTMNCNHPLVRNMIMDCLRYWVCEMHVDGFRFDLASIMGRDQNGQPMQNPPMVELIAEDPVLAQTKLIAEAWDAAGLYQVGSFSKSSRWAEWNGLFRDEVKGFFAGKEISAAQLATRLAGSADLYQAHGRGPVNSINYLSCHDGFTLSDQVSYSRKHNEANGEGNRDGMDDSFVWNSGCEGPCDNQRIIDLRRRRIKSLVTILLLSQGTPMLLAGDEFGRSQGGNNNAWCQDNPTSWLNWDLAEENQDLLLFFKKVIGLRERHPTFRRGDFFPTDNDGAVIWHGADGRPDWREECRELALYLGHIPGQGEGDPFDFYLFINAKLKSMAFAFEPRLAKRPWRLVIDSGASGPQDFFAPGEGPEMADKNPLIVKNMAVVLLAAPAETA